MKTKNHPGVYIPPPLIYVGFFFFAVLLQKLFPFDNKWLKTGAASIAGWILIALNFLLTFPAISRFIVSKNTLVTIKPANSLQTTGIYSFTRNPMYLGLLLLYCGLAILIGNWWTIILVPLLTLVVQAYIIKKEEHYLQKAFGEEYTAYKKSVSRWI
jgi:protein-S-isoprenylcysteine O-methyltransferase Ste14